MGTSFTSMDDDENSTSDQDNASEDNTTIFWKEGEVRAPLTLECLAARSLLSRDLPNVEPGTLPQHLLEEFDRIRNIHGKN